MGKLLTYLKYEGLRGTLKKCISTVKDRNKASETVFLRCCEADLSPDPRVNLDVLPLTEERLGDFESIRFFDHISGQDYIGQDHGDIFLGYLDGELVAYAATEFDKRKVIHGLGFFHLAKDEAWVGPVYVKRSFRGKGINREMLKRAMEKAEKKNHIRCFYTCINRENTASRKSFLHTGFREQGHVTCRNGQYTCRLEEEIAHKFSPIHQ